MHYERCVAIGDSQSEGLNDPDGRGGFRGWADRFAEHLATVNPSVTYANLAIRGKVTRQIRDEQLEPALALDPDLISMMCGLNDVLRRAFDLDATVANLDAMAAAFHEQGAHILMNTFPNVGKIMPIAGRLMPRVSALNQAIRDIGRANGATVVDVEDSEDACDRRIWSDDRIHANELGHERIAFGFARELGVPGFDSEDILTSLPAHPRHGLVGSAQLEATFIASHAAPWVLRRLRGRSSGDGMVPKRPQLTPVRAFSVQLQQEP